MLLPGPAEDELQHCLPGYAHADEVRKLRQTYTRSGLYRNDGSAEPLWTVDWYAEGVLVLSDGAHLVRFGKPYKIEDEALTFFAHGHELATYRVKDLVARPEALPKNPWRVPWLSESHLDEQKRTFAVKTTAGDHYVFDVTTGQVVAPLGGLLPSSVVGRWVGLILALVLLALAGGLVWYVTRQLRPAA
jgi:hypothetical protein